MKKQWVVVALFYCSSLFASTTREVFIKYPNSYFVETGSFYGEGIQAALEAGFTRIHSIELSPLYFRRVQGRFSSNQNVTIHRGDSAKILGEVISTIGEPITFWLDGHCSLEDTAKGETMTPLLAELEQIKRHPIKTHTILIDDVRMIGTVDFDFITLEQIVAKLKEINPDYLITYEDGYERRDILVASLPLKNQPGYEIVTVPGQGSFYVDSISDVIKDVLKSGKAWEPNADRLIHQYAKPGSIVLDVGAHIGTHTVALSQSVGTTGQVLAFEPQPKIFRELCMNIRLNQCENVRPINCALGMENGSIFMGEQVFCNEGSRFITTDKTGEKVALKSLDSFQLQNVSFMKVDIENYEEPFLLGARETLLRCKPVMLIEIQGNCVLSLRDGESLKREKTETIIEQIKALGYSVSHVSDDDYLALPRMEVMKSPSKIAYPLTNEPIDVVIPCAEKDLLTLEFCIQGIRKNGINIRRVIVISEKPYTNSAEWFDEKKYPFSKFDLALHIFGNEQQASEFINLPNSKIGWIYQQFLKLFSLTVIPDISANVLILDADVIFLNRTQFLDEEGHPLFNPGRSMNPAYFEHMKKVIPWLTVTTNNLSGISHSMLFQKAILEDFLATIGSFHNEASWKSLCKCINQKEVSKPCMSEYELYFNFALAKTDQAKLRALTWDNISSLNQLENYAQEGYHFVACHDYLRAPK